MICGCAEASSAPVSASQSIVSWILRLNCRHCSIRARKWPERIVVRDGDRFDFVAVDSIDWVESANNYVQPHCGPRRHLLNESLTKLEGRLNPARFVRVHRGRIVNLARVAAIHPLFGGTCELELRSGTRLTSGRQYKYQIQALLRS